jgi:hypothetical protein
MASGLALCAANCRRGVLKLAVSTSLSQTAQAVLYCSLINASAHLITVVVVMKFCQLAIVMQITANLTVIDR